ncbi:efflux RND transporter permease subunit [Oceanispirochaeta sp.]|jgi:HAE1 family hydrophobic/amphiphilic exporter-1|uniref:efflux RND transporter permease subunit n=1 Tax=Oceanispirochaeta sp. TaxID=2035350 RepID=UPI0026102C51|nr:efflux RND transporter permease subunit [Oceanispirochaeta sp.]MDA3955400.1 efflux RND transporter permease subunit [Oceanispirochaeta sp.]
MNITELSVKRPVTILILTALLTGLAAFMVPDLTVELYPSVSPPYISVSTRYNGASPLEVEESVTRLLEKQLSNVTGLKNLRSTSREGNSRISMEFDYSTDLDEATSDVRDSLERVTRALPDGADSPAIFKFNLANRAIMTLIVQGNEPADRLKTVAEDTVQPLLERLEGVSSAEVRGGHSKIIKVEVAQSRLEAYNLSLSQVSSALSARNIQSGAGSVSKDGLEYTLRVDEKFKSLEDIRRTVITTMNSTETSGSINRSRVVRLEDIANVSEANRDVNSIVYVNGSPSISLSIQNESGSNIVQVADNILEALPEINKELPAGITLSILYDNTTMIRNTLGQVYKAALQGAVLAMLVLFFFLRNIKSTLIIGLSIPIALLITMMGMFFFNLTLNLISLTGLILGLGMIVDNSIVILENIYRYRERGAKLVPAAILGSREMVTAIMASTMTTLCVFIPLIIWKDNLEMMGQMFEDLIFTVVLSLIISLITAVTLVPALSSHYLKLDSRVQKPLKNRFLILLDNKLEGFLVGMEKGYRRALVFALKNKALILTLVVLLLTISIELFGTLGMNLQPRPRADDSVRISLTMPVGTSLERTELFIQEMRQIVENEVKGYENLILNIGSSGGGGGNTYTGSIEITLPPVGKQIDTPTDIQRKIRPFLNQYPEATFAFSAGRWMRTSSAVDIEIFSNDLDLASRTALEIRDLLKENLPQVEDPVSSMEDGGPEFRILIDTDRASALGLNSSTVASTIKTLVDGQTATTYWKDGNELDVLVQLNPANRSSLGDLESQYIRGASGQKISLANVARMVETVGPKSISRENETRVLHVSAGLTDGVAVTDIQPLIENLLETGYVVPEGVSISYGGEAREIERFSSPLMIIIIVAVIMVFAVMASLFESLVDPLIIFFSIPLLIIGVVMVYKITGEAFSIISAVGIVVLAGIVVNNGIVMVDYTNLLRHRGEALTEAVLNAGQSRLRPILMTSLTTILGMVPMAFFPGEGTEFIRPIGQTIVGGLAVSTLITLFVTPVMYSLLNSRRKVKMLMRMKKKLLVE